MTSVATVPAAAEPATEAERRMQAALQDTEPALEEPFRRNLARARRATLRRLVTALWRDDVTGLRTTSHRLADWVVHQVGGRTTVAFPLRAEHAFDRIEPGKPVLHLGATADGGVTVVESPAGLVAVLRAGEPAPGWDTFADELDNSVANLALAYARAAIRPQPARGFEEPLLDLERHNTEGHNLHPCARTRVGMTTRDVLRYDLESDEPTGLVMVGVRRDRVESAPDERGRDVGQLLRASYPAIDQAVCRAVPDPDDYVFLPVHPWQLDAVVRPRFRDDIAEGGLVVVPRPRLYGLPTASLRTLLVEPSVSGERFFVKTALDVQITSTRRTISAHTTNNGPRYSDLIGRILADEPTLAGRVVALPELAGASYRSGDEQRARALSALVRAAPRLAEGETPVPAFALTAKSPLTGGSVLVDCVNARGGGTAAALGWLEDYASLLLTAMVTLMTKYGIGLEAHLQNCIPTLVGAAPHRLLLRDWGGIRIYPPRLERHRMRVDRRPGAVTVTDDVAEMRTRALSTTLSNHLGEIVHHLVSECGVREADAWTRVGRVLDAVLSGLWEQPAWRADVRADRQALFAPRMAVKALARMRLRPEAGDQYVDAPNPLRT